MGFGSGGGVKTTSILEIGADEAGGEGYRGLLVSLLTIMDIDHEQTLSQAEYVQAAKPLGFDATDDAWAGLCARFGDKTSKERPKTAEEVKDTALDLKLLGAYFQNRYDSLLEELLRRLLKGIVYTSKRSEELDRRLQIVEDTLDTTVLKEKREREAKVQKTLRRWKHQYTSVAFEGGSSSWWGRRSCGCGR